MNLTTHSCLFYIFKRCPFILLSLIIFMLVIMKYFGCRPMSLIRNFSSAVEIGKVKKKSFRSTNYYAPLLSEENKQVKILYYHLIITYNYSLQFLVD